MLNSTVSKTIFIKRWMLISWMAGMAALVVFTMIFYPSLSKSFADTLKSVPDSLKAFIGNSQNYTTVAGYVDLQVFFQFSYIILIFGVILFTGVLAGEESDGTLQTLLAQPISRKRVYFEKLLASMILLAGVCLSLAIGVVIGLLIIRGHLSLGRLGLSVIAEFLLALVFSALSYVIGAATGKRGLAGGIAGIIAFISLLVTSLATSVKALRLPDKFSPFHYFDKPGILLYGPRWSDFLVLLVISLVMLAAGYFLFIKRDIYQR